MPTFTDDVVVNDANNGTQVVANGTAPGNGGGVRVQKAGTDVGVAAVSGAIKGTSEAHLMVQATSGRKILLAANGATTEQVTLNTDGSVDVAGHVRVPNTKGHYSSNTAGFLVPVPLIDIQNTMYCGSDNAQGVNSLVLGSGQAMIFNVNTGERARINTLGHMGIGTATPRDTLDVFGRVVVRGPEPWIDVRSYGALGNGGDDTTAIQNAINAVPAPGGTVYFPAGFSFACDGQLNLDYKTNIRLVGGRAGEDTSTTFGVVPNPPTLLYRGTGPSFISMRSAGAITMTGLTVRYSHPSFVGDLIQCGHGTQPFKPDSSYLRFEHCSFSGWGADVFNARSLIFLNHTIISSISDCWFGFAKVGVYGQFPSEEGAYSNAIQIERCTFNYQDISSIKNAGEAWSIIGCTFEPGKTPANTAAYTQDLNTTARGFTWIGNWFGDVPAEATGTWISAKVAGLHFAANFFVNPAGVTSLKLTDSFGAHISGNHFENGTAIALAGSIMDGLAIMGNQFWNVPSKVTNTGIIVPNRGSAQGNGGFNNQTW